MNATTILEEAQRILDGTAAARNRMACWLARTALETTVRDLLQARRVDPGDGTMASLLICLDRTYADQPDVAARAHFTWTRLSHACHQHAFELSPTSEEARHLIDNVRRLTLSAAAPESAGSA